MARGRSFADDCDQLGSEARSVLAVLMLAAHWPERFPGGWVSVDEFGRAGLYLGERRSRESLKAAIRRGGARLRVKPLRVVLETRRTLAADPLSGRPRREIDRRMALPAPTTNHLWLLSSGPDLIAPDHMRDFHRQSEKQSVLEGGQLTATLRHADVLVLLALRHLGNGSAHQRRLSELHRLLRSELNG